MTDGVGEMRSTLVCGLAVLVAMLLAGVRSGAIAQEPSPPFRLLPNVAIDGDVLLQSRSEAKVDTEQCRAMCSQTPLCAGFTAFPDGHCVIYSSVSERQRLVLGASSAVVVKSAPSRHAGSHGGAHSGSGAIQPLSGALARGEALQCPAGFRTEHDVTAFGGDLSLRGLSVSFERCAEICLEKKECAGFVWTDRPAGVNRDDKCQLKSRLRVTAKSDGAVLCERAETR